MIALATLLGWGVVNGDWQPRGPERGGRAHHRLPGALGLATPMAVAAATGRVARAGLFVRDASAFERMDRLATIVFDKTGTLTEGRPSVVDVADRLRLGS